MTKHSIRGTFKSATAMKRTTAPRELALFQLLDQTAQAAAIHRMRRLAWPIADIARLTGLSPERLRQILEEVPC